MTDYPDGFYTYPDPPYAPTSPSRKNSSPFQIDLRQNPANLQHVFRVAIDDRWFMNQVFPQIVSYISDLLINQMAEYLGDQALQRIEMNKEKMLDQIVMKARTRRFRLESE